MFIELAVVVSPFTIKLPVTIRSSLIITSPVKVVPSSIPAMLASAASTLALTELTLAAILI